MTDLVLRQVSESRAGAERLDDYDVIGADGLVIRRPRGRPGCGRWRGGAPGPRP